MYQSTNPLFRDLNDIEEAEFRAWTRSNYDCKSDINPSWHPVVIDECQTMLAERLVEMDVYTR